jgi:hypothetical protein
MCLWGWLWWPWLQDLPFWFLQVCTVQLIDDSPNNNMILLLGGQQTLPAASSAADQHCQIVP